MKIKLCLTAALICNNALAGGTIGGGGSGLVNDEIISLAAAFNIESLPKSHIGPENFRRLQARLSVAGIISVPVFIDGESIQIKSWLNNIVNVDVSKEYLP